MAQGAAVGLFGISTSALSGEPPAAVGCHLVKRIKESERLIDLLFYEVYIPTQLFFKEVKSRESRWKISPILDCVDRIYINFTLSFLNKVIDYIYILCFLHELRERKAKGTCWI